MQFPESWLREFCNPPITTDALANLLTMAGMEVEEARPAAPPFTQVVVGQVLGVERHPGADRLNVCQVDVGRGSPLNIVCGAPNVRAGIKVPCALVGAELPPAADDKDGKPFVIKLGKLRGVESQGMLCSARELKLSDDHGGLLILSDTATVGEDIRKHLRLDDTLFTLKLTPNLGHCLSVYGIAREVAALTGAPLKTPAFPPVAASHRDTLPVKVQATDLCGRFSGRIVRKVNPKATTPTWMVDRLARCGQRSVTALVDISNYVMFEYGHPSHIFDLDKIHGALTVRWGRAGESLKLLNGNTIELDGAVGVIADDEAVESLAGIMGGDATAVSDDTRNIYVEAAFWWPEAVSGRSRRFNFSTDAGHRFERGVDPALTVEHIERITRLIIDICGGEAGPIDDQAPSLPERKPVTLRVARAAKVIGMPVSQAQCEGVMQRLGLQFTSAPGLLTVAPPSWRFDLQIEEDLIEEVVRVIGYQSLPNTPPLAPVTARLRSEASRSLGSVRRSLAALDYQETINFSFVEERWEHELAGNADPIRVLNPIASPLAVMRSSLLGSLVNVLRVNLARKATRVRVFESGRVFMRAADAADGPLSVAGVHQPMRLAGLAYGSADAVQWGAQERPVDFFDVKGDIEALLAPHAARFVPAEHPAMHPGRCARVEIDGEPIGFVGELHPKWRQAYELPSAPVLFELDSAALLARDVPTFAPLPRQQSAWRDLSVIAGDGVTHDALMQAITADLSASHAGLVRSARLFDIYRPANPAADIGPGERSLAIRLELLDDEATLTDPRIDSVVADVLQALKRRLGVRLRA
ncbi:MAG: phenylalanyl-tRNA synthetase subunit beta [Methylibium sp. NZG]|nr:MAG: phenylalanyl-tRNA synthetase subunit beta [Methylibium sp. NZG]